MVVDCFWFFDFVIGLLFDVFCGSKIDVEFIEEVDVEYVIFFFLMGLVILW